MTLTIALVCAAALLALAAVGVIMGRSPRSTRVVYGASLIIAAVSFIAGLAHLLGAAVPFGLTLPLGVPWLGAHFRLDALSAFFLVVVDLGAVSASLFALGYGEHETAPQRVLPFYAAFLAGMTLVVLADDAYTFLFSWEFMSLTSWALVMSHPRVAGKRARRLRLSGDGELRHAHAAVRLRPPGRPGRPLHFRADARRASFGGARRAGANPGADRSRLEGRHRPAACMAAARPSGGAEPRLRADERRDDQGRRLRLRAHRLRARRPPGLVVEHRRARRRRRDDGDGRALRADAARSEAAACLSHGGKYRHHLHRARPVARLQRQRPAVRRGAGTHCRAAARL